MGPNTSIDSYRLDTIDVTRIEIFNRSRTDFGDVEDLARSIKDNGLISPIAVIQAHKTKGDYNYILIAGERRVRAHKMLGLGKIAAKIFKRPLNHDEVYTMELEENINRKDMDAAEIIILKKRVHDARVALHGEAQPTRTEGEKVGHSIADTAKIFNESAMNTSRDLNLARVIEEMPELVEKGDTKADLKRKIDELKKRVKVKQKLEAIKQDEGNTDEEKEKLIKSYINTDFLSGVSNIPDGSIDFLDIDFAYPIDAQEESNTNNYSSFANDVKSGEYKNYSREEFPDHVANTLKECYRIAKDGSWIIVWFGNEYFDMIRQAINNAGFRHKWYTGKWWKMQGFTQVPNTYLRHSFENFFYAQKGTAKLNKPGTSDLFSVRANRHHPAEKPIDLMGKILTTFISAGSRIVVPFAGSGNTLLAASNKKMVGIGFDTSKKYKDEFTIKVHEGTHKKYKDKEEDKTQTY